MAETLRRKIPHWIDHVGIGTNNINAWYEWSSMVLGLKPCPIDGLTTHERKRNVVVHGFLNITDSDSDDVEPGESPHHVGVFVAHEILPRNTAELGKATPSVAFYALPEDMDAHRERLEQADEFARNPGPGLSTLAGTRLQRGIPYSDPVRTTIGGEEGTVLYFEDPDGNQWEFWAPDEMPDGAMNNRTPFGVGRIARLSFGCAELERNAKFFSRYCGLEPIATESNFDTLVMPLVGGPRIIYQRLDGHDARAREKVGAGVHAALSLPADDLIPMLEEMWADLPENEPDGSGIVADEGEFLPPHTEMHSSPVGRRWKEMLGRGDFFSDWDGNLFHFFGIYSNREDGALIDYETRSIEEYLHDLAEAKGLEIPQRAPV